MSRDEVAELLGIKPNSVRDTLRRYGITEQRGYPRAAVERLQRLNQGRRTDIKKVTHVVQKIPTLFQRNPENMRFVTTDVNPAAEWVLEGDGVATRKFDGTCVRLDAAGNWWARREVKPGKNPPNEFVAVEHDETTGKTVGWEPIAQSPFVKMWNEATTHMREAGEPMRTGTFELCGPKINGNPERFDHHVLIRHGIEKVDAPRTFDALATWLHQHDFEGVVWHHHDGRMAKLKKRDFQLSH